MPACTYECMLYKYVFLYACVFVDVFELFMLMYLYTCLYIRGGHIAGTEMGALTFRA